MCGCLGWGHSPLEMTLMLSPAASYTTEVFFGAAGLYFDLASLSFQVPRFASSAAIHAAATANNTANVNKQIILFIESPYCDFFRFEQRGFAGKWPNLDPRGARDGTLTLEQERLSSA